MTKRALFALAALALSAGGLLTHAQSELPPAPPARPAAAAPPAAPAIAPAAVAAPAPPAGVTAVLAPAAPHALVAPPAALAPALAPLPPQRPGEVSIFHFSDNFLGIHVEEVTSENMGRYGVSGEPRGVGVREVVRESPAERAGLRAGDLILRFDGEQVSTVRKLNRLIDESAPEHTARITVRRGGSEQELSVKLGKREAGRLFGGGEWRGWSSADTKLLGEQMRKQAEEMRGQMKNWRRDNPGLFTLVGGGSRRIGVSTSPLGKQLAEYFGVQHGALVSSVEDGSPAARAGLKAGDVVTEVDGEKVDSSGDLSRLLNRRDEGEVTLTVVRDRNRRTVRVTPEKRATPGGIEFGPGSFVIEAPSVAVTTPAVRVTPPRITVAPSVRVEPRIQLAPRVRAVERTRIL